MASSALKTPPVMTEDLPYREWKTEIDIWCNFTDLSKKKQGGAIFLTLQGKARETIRSQLSKEEIASETAVQKILDTLDKLYLNDEQQSGFIAYDEFVNYRRPSGTSIKDYIVEFNLKIAKLKTYDMELPEGVLAYNLLKCANLSEEQQQMCRATTKKMTYEEMRQTIEKVTISITSSNTKESSDENHFNPLYCLDTEETLYTANSYGRRSFQHQKETPVLNPCDENGKTTTCSFCHSVYHWISKCPDAPSPFRQNRGRGFRGRHSYRSTQQPRRSYRGKPL